MSTTKSPATNSRLAAMIGFSLLLVALHFGKEILLPFALAIFFTFILNPLVRRLERLHIPRGPAAATVVLAACLAVGSLGWIVTNQVVELSGMLPEYKGNLLQKMRTVKGVSGGKLERASETIQEIGEELDAESESAKAAERSSRETLAPRKGSSDWLAWFTNEDSTRSRDERGERAVAVKVVSLPPSPLRQVQSWLGPLVAPLTSAGIVVVLTLFLLLTREDSRSRLLQLIGTAHLHTTTQALEDAAQRISSLLRMQLLVNAIYGACVGLGLYIIGVPSALLWGLLGTLLRFLPYVGPWLVASLPIALSLAVFDDWMHVLLTAGLFIILELLVNNVLEPWLYGVSIGVSSIGIIVAAIFWTWLWGPIGLVLAMPITVCLVVAGHYIPQLRFVSVLFGDRPSMTHEERLYQRLLANDDDEVDHLVATYAKDCDLESIGDDLVIPTLYLIERDRYAGIVHSDERLSIILESLHDAVYECVGTLSEAEGDRPNHGSGKILCVPAHDATDQCAASLVCDVLRSDGFECELSTNKQLVAEVVELANAMQVVLISALPPNAVRHARYLCKRLRERYPNLPIIVGLWSDNRFEKSRERFAAAGATCTVSTIAEARRQVTSVMRRAQDSSATVLPHANPSAV